MPLSYRLGGICFVVAAFLSSLSAQTTILEYQTLLTIPDIVRPPDLSSFDIELEAYGPVLSNISVVKARDLPMRIGVVADESGSGRDVGQHGIGIERALDSTSSWLRHHGGDAFLVAFNDEIVLSTPLVTDVARLRHVASQLQPFGGSAVLDALVHAARRFGAMPPEQRPYIRVILLISDGGDNASYVDERHAIEEAQREGVRVYTISFPSSEASSGKHLLENIAKRTGGQAFSPTTDKQRAAALTAIGDDLDSSYLVAFAPEARDSKLHPLTIRLRSMPNQPLRFMLAFAAQP